MMVNRKRNENVYRVSIKVEKHECKFGRTRNDLGTRDKIKEKETCLL